MSIKELVQRLVFPAWLIGGIFSLATFISHFSGAPVTGLLAQFDLRLEANLAAWAASASLLLACLSCLVLAHPPLAPQITRLDLLFFKAAALGLLTLSALEISQLHNLLSLWVQNAWRGWETPGALIVGCAALPFVAAGWLYYLRFILRCLPFVRQTRLAIGFVSVIAAAPPLWGYLTVIEKLAWGKQGGMTLLACLEETLEVGMALAVTNFNLITAQGGES